eukprot:273177_1
MAVVFTGGCYPALALVSSRLFGLQILTSGLTQYELKGMSTIKVIGTVVLENIPQLICQLLYASSIGQFTQAVQLALIASLLSATAATLNFLLDRDTEDTKAVQYYLSLKCTDRDNATPIAMDGSDDEDELEKLPTTAYNLANQDDGEDEEGEGYEEKGHGTPYTATGHHRLRTQTRDLDEITLDQLEDNDQNTNASPITPADQLRSKEKKKIIKNRGRTAALGKNLAECFSIPPKNIEIGCCNITNKGLIVHVVQYVSTEELDIVTRDLREANCNQVVTPELFTKQLYLEYQEGVENVLRDHFKLDKNNDFHVDYQDMYSIHARKISTGITTPAGTVHNTTSVDNARRGMLKRMATQIELAPLADTMDSAHDSEHDNEHHRDNVSFQQHLAMFFANHGYDEAQLIIKQELAAFAAGRDQGYERKDNDRDFSRESWGTGSDSANTCIEHEEESEEQHESDLIMRRASVTNDNEALAIHIGMQAISDKE